MVLCRYGCFPLLALLFAHLLMTVFQGITRVYTRANNRGCSRPRELGNVDDDSCKLYLIEILQRLVIFR